ncbi:hypothetical protein PVL29_014231 [Vitis rotundifolia]|uniref:Late embryogenesis abundant protein LEA-2 subgroup domain-containing protein n=1 Tax=Vitis rotundifolia TaxID=103349 RepID=A0AA38ZGL9_VITRO|nr:hypothetical protein PVL29_014231 [Vitis rotundifolia]
MTTSRDNHVYAPIGGDPNHQNVVVLLPVYYPRRRRLLYRLYNAFLASAVLLSLSAAVYLLYPSDPTVQVVGLHLNSVQVHTSPVISLDLSLALTIRVRNRDFFSFSYTSLTASVGYRGRPLGFVNSSGGYLRARGSSYINATLDLDGIKVLHDVFYLLEDLARGSIPFDTVTEVRGELGLIILEIPLKARVSCEVYVNTNNQTIIHQDCYPM